MKEAAKDQDKFVLRMPEGMRARIRSMAHANNRSMNAEIISTLEDCYPPQPGVNEVLGLIEVLTEKVESRYLPGDMQTVIDILKRLEGALERASAEDEPVDLSDDDSDN